jgi:hypothetical protein
MTEPHKVHCYARVAQPYESVRDVLHGLLGQGEARTPLSVHSVWDQHDVAGLPDLTRATLGVEDDAPLEWSELASAEIYASSLSPSETHIEIEAHCVDRAGCSMDVATRHAADTHVHNLLERLVERIRRAAEAFDAAPSSTARPTSLRMTGR